MLQSMGSQRVRHDWATELNGTEPSSDHWCSLFIPPTFPWRIYSPGLLYDYLISPTSNISLFISINDDIPYLTERAEQQKKTSTSLYLNPPISLNSCLPSHHCGCMSNRHLSILPSKADIYSDVWSSSLPIHLRTLGLPMSLLSFHVPTLLDHFY